LLVICKRVIVFLFSFFFIYTATTEIYTLSLHDALPILDVPRQRSGIAHARHVPRRIADAEEVRAARARESQPAARRTVLHGRRQDRKSTRLNSSHVAISYAVFCLKKKKIAQQVHESRSA